MTSASQPAPRLRLSGHIPALDGLRGFIILIIFHHFNYLKEGNGVGEQLYLAVVHLSQMSLDVFFVVSGFLITGILYDSKGGQGYFKNFYIRRTLRIFPLYYGFLLFWFVVLPLVIAPLVWRGAGREFTVPWSTQAWYWAYLTNMMLAVDWWVQPRNTTHLWSLAVEEQFYLVWPLLVLVCSRRRLMAVCLACVALAPLIRTGLWLAGAHPNAGYTLMPARMDSLALGALVALVARGPGGLQAFVRPAWLAGGLAVVAALGILAATGGFDEREPIVQTVGWSVSSLLGGAILVLTLMSGPGSFRHRLTTSRVLLLFGTYSYAIYVFHWPLALVGEQLGFTPLALRPLIGSPLLAQLAYSLAMIVVSLAAGAASWHLYEKHFLKLKVLFPYGRRGATAAARKREAAAVAG